MNSTRLETTVGAFVLLGLIAIAYLALKIGGGSFVRGDTMVVHARFNNAAGVNPGSNVVISGVTVGRVDAVRLNPQDFSAVVDMRLRFGLSDVQYNDFTVVIVLNVAGRTIGMVVDSVSDVLELPGGQIRPAPEFSGAVDASYITGIATLKLGETSRMLILMDIESLMRSPEMGLTDAGLAH